MNKLILTTASAIIICGCLVYANTGKTTTDNSLEFMNAFKNCDQFSSVDVIEVDPPFIFSNSSFAILFIATSRICVTLEYS